MDTILNIVQSFFWISVLVGTAIVTLIFIKFRYKIPKADQALVITGGKKGLRALPGQGAFVSPFKKHQFFPLGVMTVRSSDQETQTQTLIPVVVKWTAQLRADVETEGALDKAARGFGSYETEAISDSLQQTLDGEVRAVVATMSPEGVITDKVNFAEQVSTGVAPRMEELGFKLVSLNIAEVSDRNNYYSNLAAEDREAKREEAETLTAKANQQVAIETAKADQASREAGLDRDLAIEEKNRNVTIRKAAIKAETDAAEADAAIAGGLQTEIRNQELAARKGEVKVIEAQQDQSAATAQREAELTRAETAKQRREIEAAADGRKAEIDATSAAAVAKAQAQGQAEATKAKAQGEADALTLTTTAKANEVRATGQANADAARAKGEAEAAVIRSKGEAEAEVQLKLAEALAANEGANLRVTLAEIQRDTTISVYTAMGETMAHVGEKATFIDMGGSSSGGGDLLSNVLGNIPELFKKLDVKSQALNGLPFGESLGKVVATVSGKSPVGEPEVVDVVDDQPEVEPEISVASDESVDVTAENGEPSEGESA